LRQASDSEEEQPKTAPRRGRPPKNAKKPVEKVEDDVSPDLSSVKTNRLAADRTRNTNVSMRDSYVLHHNTIGSYSGKRTEKPVVYSGLLLLAPNFSCLRCSAVLVEHKHG
jgi:hypothetical protein